MKRFLTVTVAFLLIFSAGASAQAKWGVTAGMNFNTSKFTDIDVKAKAGWSAGLTALVDLPLGFSLQPSLVYSQKGANLVSGEIANASQTVGFIELPVSVQWGPDLLLFRPFIDVTPYVGYAVSNKYAAQIAGVNVSGNSDKWDGLQRFEYGLGLGAGVNVWKLQVIARYCWNFGSLYNVDGWNDIKDHLNRNELSTESKNFGGINISVAFLF